MDAGSATLTKKGFLLHTFQRTRKQRSVVYGIGKLAGGETFGLVDYNTLPRCYVYQSSFEQLKNRLPDSRAVCKPSTRLSMDGQALMVIETNTVDQLKKVIIWLEEQGISTFEGDIPAAKRYRIKNNVHGPLQLTGKWQAGREVDWIVINPHIEPIDWEPDLAVLSIDIETNREATLVTAISFVGTDAKLQHQFETVVIVGPSQAGDPSLVVSVPSEQALLQETIRIIRSCDPDIITGWNVIDFDLKVLVERFKVHRIPFTIGRSNESCYHTKGSVWGGGRVTVFGRQVMDAMHLARFTLTQYEDYRLETVAQATLGRGKLLKANDWEDMAAVIEKTRRENPALFAEYCLEDARLVLAILEREDLIPLSLKRGILTGLPLENAWGSVAAFEFLYLSELHRRSIVATFEKSDADSQRNVPGGYVFPPVVGIHANVFVFDFKSLYPSIIRTFNIDPLAMIRAENAIDNDVITAFNNTRFTRERGILPEMLDIFFDQRAAANSQGNALASYTYKIVMNSFYGVLGTHTSRFASGRLAGAITLTGHYLMQWCRNLLQDEGYRVLYGDTDSLFIDARLPEKVSFEEARQKGTELCAKINVALAAHLFQEHGIESRLELEFEKIYRKLLLPPVRGRETRGRAKGYAGVRQITATEQELQIVGMEAVRRDWTTLSHQFQKDLFNLLFHDTAAEAIETFIFTLVHEIRTGKKDDQLVYRKALRKPVENYTKTTPPHVKAARMMPNPSGVIHYVITIQGPQPVHIRSAPIDYDHYIDKQIKPILETVAPFCDVDVHAALTGEHPLF